MSIDNTKKDTANEVRPAQHSFGDPHHCENYHQEDASWPSSWWLSHADWDGHRAGTWQSSMMIHHGDHDGDGDDCRGRGDEVWAGQGRHLGKSLRRHIPGDRTTSTAELKLNLCENSIKCQYSSYTRQKNHTRQKTQNHTFLVTTDHTNHTTLKPDVCQNGI